MNSETMKVGNLEMSRDYLTRAITNIDIFKEHDPLVKAKLIEWYGPDRFLVKNSAINISKNVCKVILHDYIYHYKKKGNSWVMKGYEINKTSEAANDKERKNGH